MGVGTRLGRVLPSPSIPSVTLDDLVRSRKMETSSPGTSVAAFAVSAKHILLSEILSVTSVMRKNSRWALSTPSFSTRDSALASSLGLRVSKSSYNMHASGHGSTEQELMTGFQDLKRLVKDIEGQ